VHELSVLTSARCRFSDGTLERLHVTGLSLDGASLLALEPPLLGSTVDVTIHTARLDPLPTITARVIRVRRDAALVEHNGFEVSFLDTNEALLDRLASALVSLDEARPPQLAFARQRAGLHISCQIGVVVETSSGAFSGVIMDLSVAGALICVAANALDVAPARGEMLRLLIATLELSDGIAIGARVAWTAAAPRQCVIGVQFDSRESETRIRIRDLILDSLAPTTLACRR
jgi:PilZ domain